MPEETKQFNERRIWYFTCDKCGKTHRQSHRKKNARDRICLRCRMMQVPENQPALFDEEILKHGMVGEISEYRMDNRKI